MRRNRFGEAYCTSISDVYAVLDEQGVDPSECYAIPVDHERDEKPCLEVFDNVEGETQFFIEADTTAKCNKIADEVGIEVQL